MKTTQSQTVVYGVYGIMEWQALIHTGRSSVRIPFTGGMLSAYGVVPATFSTANPALQRLIEQSAYFRRGKIVRVR